MSDCFRRLRHVAPLALAALLAISGAQAQEGQRTRGGEAGNSRQLADPDRAANAAREATGGRVLGVQGADRDGQPGYRVRILQPDGRVRSLHYDSGSGKMQD